MYQTSEKCSNYLNTAYSRDLCAKLVCGKHTATDGFVNIKITQRSQAEDKLTIGSTCAAQVEIEMTPPSFMIEGQEFSLFIGVKLSESEIEYIPMGIFTAEHPEKTKNRIKFSAYDRMVGLGEMSFFSELSYPTTSDKVLKEICNQMGVSYALESNITATTIAEKPEGYTRREMLGYLVSLYGSFACFDRKGNLRIGWYETKTQTVNFDKANEPSVEENDFSVKGFLCAIDSETECSAGTVTGSGVVNFANPFMTQSTLERIYAAYKNFKYRAGTISLLLGDPRIDAWDVLSVTWNDETYSMPCMEVTFEFDGGLSMSVQAFAESEVEAEVNYKSPSTQAMERTSTELLLVKKAIANQITVEYLAANYAKITELTAVEAKIDDLKATQITADYLTTNYAKIDLANIKAGSITTAMISTGAIGTAQIADGSITDAKIIGLTANKITAGTLDAGTIEVVNLNAANITVGQINGVQIAAGAIDLDHLGTDVTGTLENLDEKSDAANQAAELAQQMSSDAASQADKALTTADGKNTVYYRGSPPEGAGLKENDTWFDTSNDNKIYHWDGSAWVENSLGTQAIANGAIDGDKLKDSAVTSSKIEKGAVTTECIAVGCITPEQLAAGAVTSEKIALGAIVANRLNLATHILT